MTLLTWSLALLHEGDAEDPEEVGHDEGEDESVPVLLQGRQLIGLLLLVHHCITNTKI